MTPRALDIRLAVWYRKHRPHCPTCRQLSQPPLECARIWAPEWAAQAYPVDELSDPMLEQVLALQRDLDNAQTLVGRLSREHGVLQREVEVMRRDLAQLRESAQEDFEAAMSWRRHVARCAAAGIPVNETKQEMKH